MKDALQAAALAVSSAKGATVFQELTRYLATILGVQLALVGRLTEKSPRTVQTLGIYGGGGYHENFEYQLAPTPCSLLAGGDFAVVPRDLRTRFPDDQYLPRSAVAYAGYPLKDAEGRAIGVIAVVSREPITDPELCESVLKIFAVRAAAELERREHEERLRASEANYRAIFEAAEDAIFVHDWDTGAILDVNPKACEAYGYSREELKRLRVADVSSNEPPYTEADSARLMDEVRAGGGPLRFEWHRRNRDGSLHWDEVTLKKVDIAGRAHILAITREITARKQAVEALRASESQYRAIFNAAADSMVLRDADFRVVDVNPAYERMSGRRREEALGQDGLTMSPPELNAHVKRLHARALGGEPVVFEARARRKDGSRFDIETRGVPILHEGRPHVLYIGRDITARKTEEELLRASEAQYRAIFDASEDALVLWDENQKRVDINPAYERIYGFTREEVLRGDYAQRVPAHYAERRRELVRRTLAGERSQAVLDSVRKDGSHIVVEVRTIPIQHRGRPHVLAISRDITERRRTEELLRASEEQYRAIFNASVDGMLLWDADHRAVDVNQAFLAMHGYRRDEIVGETRPVFIPAELQAQCATLLPEVLGGKPCRIEARSLRRDGSEFDVEIHGVPMQYQGRPHVLVIVRDVTSRRRAEALLRSSEERYRLLFEMESDAILLVDADTLQLVDMNPVAEALWGYSRAELLAMKATDLSVEPEATRSSVQQPAGTHTIPLRWHRRKDGTVFPVEITANRFELDGRRIVLAAVRDISERRNREEALARSEARLRATVEAAFDCVVGMDSRGRVIEFNPAAERTFGYRRADVLGRPLAELIIPPRLRAAHEQGIAHFRRTGQGPYIGRRVETFAMRADGIEFPVELAIAATRMGDEDVFVGYLRDITERKKTEAAVRASEAQYRAIFEASADALVLWDEDMRRVDVNPAFERIFGWSREEALAHADQAHIPKSYARRRRELLQRTLEAGEPAHAELESLRKDGSRVLVEVRTIPFQHRGARHVLAIATDVTERRAAEERLRESEERHRLLFEMESDAIVLVDVETLQHIDVNRAAVELYGYSREELLGLRSTDLSAEGAQTRAAMQSGARQAKGFVRVPLRYHRKKDGTVFPVEITANFFDLHGRRIMLAAIRDITERKQAEEARSQLEAQLRQAQKMEAIGQLTGGIAHDFNNILQSILGNLTLAGERLEDLDEPRLTRYLERAQLSAQRARELIQQMLTFSRGRRGEPRLLALVPVVGEAAKLLRPTLPSTIEVQLDLAAEAPPVKADPVQLEQVLLNLCINARDAMQGQGTVTLAVREVAQASGVCASCRGRFLGRFVELSVRDSGPGIAPEVLERMFEPFYSTKEVGKGSGMGLSTVHGIVHEHGGHVQVDTRPGEGTVFRVLFPAAAGEAGPEEKKAGPKKKARLTGRVLVVDDEEMIREFLADLLESWGLEVALKADGLDGKHAFAAEPQRYDVVLTDQTMPRVTGLELARQIRAIRPGTPVILYTGYGEHIAEEDLAAAGVRALARKPVDSAELFALLKTSLQQSRNTVK